METPERSAANLHQAELETADEMIGELLRLNDRYHEALERIKAECDDDLAFTIANGALS